MWRLLTIPFLFIYGMFTYGIITLKFYNWFILPVFTTLPQIDFFQAIGISCFLALFKNHYNSQDKEFAELLGERIFGPLLILFFGWIIMLIIS